MNKTIEKGTVMQWMVGIYLMLAMATWGLDFVMNRGAWLVSSLH